MRLLLSILAFALAGAGVAQSASPPIPEFGSQGARSVCDAHRRHGGPAALPSGHGRASGYEDAYARVCDRLDGDVAADPHATADKSFADLEKAIGK